MNIRNNSQTEKKTPPRHIAIIMDGNGRWAKKRALPRSAGHAAGAETFRTIATYARSIGVEYLTVYAFSTENWKRSEEEVSCLMQLFDRYLHESIESMEKDHIRLRILGNVEGLPGQLQELIRKTNEISARYTGFQANICLNYGGRDEIVRAARAFAQKCVSGEAEADELDENGFARYLYSDGLPDPELIIRPSGEIRISNFLLWQSAYAEYYFTDVLWPDFTEKDLDRAIEAYSSRERRFGGVKK